MSVEVIWTETAKKTLEQIKIYLIDSFTETEFQKLKKAINENINLIKKGVVQHKYFEKTNCCRVIILKKTMLFYRKTEGKIYIMALWDHRRMKGKNKFEE